MKFLHMTAIAATAAGSLAMSAVAASAYPATASSAVHVRSGPGGQYNIVDTLHRNERVDVDKCTQGYGWCHVSHSGPDGWVSSRFLADQRSRPLNQFGFNLKIPQLGFNFGVGPQGPYVGPSHGHHDRRQAARVCFYEDWNYQGNHFCAREGQADAQLSKYWNDRISSIRVYGDARVRVCQDWHYKGRCSVIADDRSSLKGRNNDIISSYRVM